MERQIELPEDVVSVVRAIARAYKDSSTSIEEDMVMAQLEGAKMIAGVINSKAPEAIQEVFTNLVKGE